MRGLSSQPGIHLLSRLTFRLLSVPLLMLSGAISPAMAQFESLPPDLQATLNGMAPDYQKAVGKNIPLTIAAFQALLKTAPRDGVTVTRNLAYGPDPKQILDVYQPSDHVGVPVVVFIHGGAYVQGDKDFGGEMFGNVATWFARQSLLGINATYRLAPTAKWPSGSDDVRGIVSWARANAAHYGGDPERIFLIGHSAGATHIAGYVFNTSLQSAAGPGVAGVVLISGRYRIEYNPADPTAKMMQAYFGDDATQYADRSPITHIRDGVRVPVFVVITEYDNPGIDVRGADLFAALCERDGACPRFSRLQRHNHMSEVAAFNTPDELLGRQILDFISRGR